MGKPLGKTPACLREAASAKAGANLLFSEHKGLRPLLESALGAILYYPYHFKITAVRSLGGRFTHARLRNWRLNASSFPSMLLQEYGRSALTSFLQYLRGE